MAKPIKMFLVFLLCIVLYSTFGDSLKDDGKPKPTEHKVAQFRYSNYYLQRASPICRIKKVKISGQYCYELVDELGINLPISCANCVIVESPTITRPYIANFWCSYEGGDYVVHDYARKYYYQRSNLMFQDNDPYRPPMKIIVPKYTIIK